MSLPNNPKLYSVMHMTPNPDGTVTRHPAPPDFFPKALLSETDSALSKDVPINTDKNTWVRIFLPRLNDFKNKLRVLVFVHGGGFVIGSPDYRPWHEFCSVVARQIDALVVSVSYRLAPEHRLPAAYEDVSETLTWIKQTEDEWIKNYADLSNCVLMGESAGGNIAYHVGLRIASQIADFKPLTIKGLILVQPYIGGLDRTQSEARSIENELVLPLDASDFCWELSLPLGSDRSNEYCDVVSNVDSGLVDRVRDLGWWVAVVACEGDPLYDRNVELAKVLEGRGVVVKRMFSEGGQHGGFVSTVDLSKRIEFLDFVYEFWT